MRHHKHLAALLVLLAATGVASAALIRRDPGAEMARAAEAFVQTLSAEQKATVCLPFADASRVDWHFIPKPERKGLQLKHMDDTQRQLAHALLASGLSQLGYNKATAIMSLERILRELEKTKVNGNIRDDERYYFTLFGDPTGPDPWGISVEGHHLSLNFVVQAGQVTAHTLAFFGANPATVKTTVDGAPAVGTRVLPQEEDLAFQLLHTLTADQRRRAVIADKAPSDLRGAAEPQAPATPPEGLAAAELDAAQQQVLKQLIQAYTDNMLPEVAVQRWAEIDDAGLDKVHFAWAGADQPGIGHYYRVQGPTFLIELCNTQPDAEGTVANHIHSFWRQLSGDFGIPR